MRAGATAYFLTVTSILMGIAAGGCSYFAAFVIRELDPFFDQHDMREYSVQAHETRICLIVSAVLFWLLDVGMLLKVCNDDFRICCPRLLILTNALTSMILAVIEMKNAWGWRAYFDEAGGLDNLASNCHWLAGMCTTNMVVVFLVMGIVICHMSPDLNA